MVSKGSPGPVRLMSRAARLLSRPNFYTCFIFTLKVEESRSTFGSGIIVTSVSHFSTAVICERLGGNGRVYVSKFLDSKPTLDEMDYAVHLSPTIANIACSEYCGLLFCCIFKIQPTESRAPITIIYESFNASILFHAVQSGKWHSPRTGD